MPSAEVLARKVAGLEEEVSVLRAQRQNDSASVVRSRFLSFVRHGKDNLTGSI